MKHGRVKINVTERDIKRGLPQIACKCPIARAIRRDGGIRKPVYVYGRDLEIGHAPHISATLPKKCETFVSNFDLRKKVKPFSFIVKLP